MNILSQQKKLVTYQVNASEVKAEMSFLFPQIQFISLANHETNIDSTSTFIFPVLLYHPIKPIKNSDMEKLSNWLKEKTAHR